LVDDTLSLKYPVFSRLQFAIAPEVEQRRVASILDTVDEAIHKTEQVITKLKMMKQGLLHDLLTRGIDDHGGLRDPEKHPEQFKETGLGLIPVSWEEIQLTSRLEFPEGQVDPRRWPYCDWPLVAPDHIEQATGRLLEVRSAREQDAISGKYVFEPGDVVYSKIRPYLRKAILAEWRGLCSADMYPLRPDAGVNQRFLLALILGEHFSRFAEAVSMRSGFPKVNREELAQYRAALPEKDEQDHIAVVLGAHDARILAEEACLGKMKMLKQGLMQDLLTGKVRVRVDVKAA
jgi:type I restriction enzyme S subunit